MADHTFSSLTPVESDRVNEVIELRRDKLSKSKDECADKVRRFLNLFVIPESNLFRRVWQIVLAILLVYTGTVFPAKLAFYDFAIPNEGPATPAWDVIHDINDWLFIIDLVLCFFLSFRDFKGKEVMELPRIVKRYLRTYFVINLIACIPPDFVGNLYQALFSSGDEEDTDELHQTLRITRLQRISRLARLVRLARLTKLVSWLKSSQLLVWLSGLRSTRVLNFMAGLGWVCHLMACGWYLVAALEDNYEKTWVYDRFGEITEFAPFSHWLNAIYWVLTVFTTVGFGDICPLTNAEIGYAMFTMLIGCVANGIILSEVINVITEADQFAREIARQKALVQGFSQHVKLRKDCSAELVDWVSNARAFQYSYDRERMKDMFLGNTLPTTLTSKLPEAIFHGHLLTNRFITCACVNQLHVPSRFVVLVALAVNARIFDAKETVYHAHDHAWNIFLVFHGVFANVAQPSEVGGISEVKELLANAGYEAFGTPRSVESKESQEEKRVEKGKSTLAWKIMHPSGLPKQEEQERFSMLGGKKGETKNETSGFVPYQLFCAGNYFGDVELLRNRKGSRRTCVRCESIGGGTLLVLGKNDLNEITQQFPMSYGAWRVIAAQREVKRRHLLSKLKTSTDYEDLAASIIQWYVRERLSKRGVGRCNAESKKWGLDPVVPRHGDGGTSTVNANFQGRLCLGAFDHQQTGMHIQSIQEDMTGVNERIDALQREMKQVNHKLDMVLDRLGRTKMEL